MQAGGTVATLLDVSDIEIAADTIEILEDCKRRLGEA